MVRAEKPKAKPKPKTRYTDKVQSERFIEAARMLGIEDTSRFNEESSIIISRRTQSPKNI
jgi:hypothetical protein